MIRAWRLTRRRHATPPSTAYSGIGAERRGGRWNRVGTRAAYAAATRSLAALEYLANVDAEDLPADLVFIGITFAETAVERAEVPTGWESLSSAAAMNYGERWLRSMTSPALAVPSAIVKAELNYVINPAHPHMHSISIDRALEDFVFDARLLKR